MGYERREYSIGAAPAQANSPVVVTKGDSWVEDHYVRIPPSGGFTSSDAVDNVVIHVRNREGDAEPVLEGTSDPPAGVTVSRPSPDLLHIHWEFTPEQTEELALTAPDGGRIPGTPAPPQPVPGQGLTAVKVTLSTAQVYTIIRMITVTQEALVF
jgi:hypothetical protein